MPTKRTSHRRMAAPKVPRPPPTIGDYQLGDAPTSKPMSYAVELRFEYQGQELGVDRVQIAHSRAGLKKLVELYDKMGIAFTRLAVMDESTGEKREVIDLPGGKLTKRAKQMIYEAEKTPRTVAVYGQAMSPISPEMGGACLYVRSNYPVD